MNRRADRTSAGTRSALLTLVLLCLYLFAPACAAQDQAAKTAQPQVGQAGKDVVWVPTPHRLIERMLQMADTGSKDVVIDLGSGDGRIPIAAAKQFGARALGIEYDTGLVELSTRSAARAGVADRVRFLRQDLFETDLNEATVVTLYVSPAIMLALRPRLLALKPDTRIVSHQFTLGDWQADEQAIVEGAPAYLWVVPARAEGKWLLRLGQDSYELQLQQEHQMLRGTVEHRGKRSPVYSGRLRGGDIRFVFIDGNGDPRAFSGRVAGDAMEGTSLADGQADLAWSARNTVPLRDHSAADLLQELRKGGYILYFRHTATDFSKSDGAMTSFEDCASQRNLTESGRAQARAIGKHIHALAIPVGDVLASPYCRTMETGMLMFGRAKKNNDLRGGPGTATSPERYAGLRKLLSTPPQHGTNLVIASHGNPFHAVAGPPYLAEGEVAVVRPLGEDFEVVARIAFERWSVFQPTR